MCLEEVGIEQDFVVIKVFIYLLYYKFKGYSYDIVFLKLDKFVLFGRCVFCLLIVIIFLWVIWCCRLSIEVS